MKDHPTAIFTTFAAPSPGDEAVNSSAAGQSHQLEQLSDEDFWAYARTLAASAAPAVARDEYLTCSLSRGDDGRQCLIPLRALHEIVRPPHRLASLPAIPAWMQGVVAWRGEIIAVADLDAYLAGRAMDGPADGPLLIARHAQFPLGLLVSACGAVVSARGAEGVPDHAPLEGKAVWWRGERAACVGRALDGVPVLDMDVLLGRMVQEIGSAAFYG
jgi:chemotaxis signal transduction protein